VLEVVREPVERRAHFLALHGRPVAGNDQFGFELSELFHGSFCSRPIRCEVLWRPMHLGLLDRDGVGGFLPGGDKSVACDQRPLRLVPQRYVSGRVTGCMQPTPAFHVRHRAVRRQGLQPGADVDRAAREQGGSGAPSTLLLRMGSVDHKSGIR